ncbi:MAG: diacylglycerol kinase family protein [Pirellulales bacterium]
MILNRSSTVLIGFNPLAGARDPRKRERVEQLRIALQVHGISSEVVSDRAALATQAAEQCRQGELRAVVAAGGDGTASDLVNRTEPGTPIALLPLGTENLLARYLRLPRDPAAVAEMIAAGASLSLDVGRANGRLFLLMAGCGFDAEVVRRLHAKRDGHITQWSYAKHILDSIRTYQYPQFQVTCRLSGRDFEVPIEHSIAARWAFVSNVPKYAGGLRFSPDACYDDGRLDVCAFQSGSCWSGLRYLFGILTGRHQTMRDCVTAQATQIVLEAAEPVPYQLDGDPGGWLPLTIDVLPRRMTVIVPQKS